MSSLSWRTKLTGLFVVIFGASVLFQVFYVIPTIRNREVEATKTHQKEVAFSISRELDTDLKQTTARLVELSKRPAFQEMHLVAMQDIMTTIVQGSFRFESLSVLNVDGWFVCSTMEDFSAHGTSNYADQPYFTVPFEQGQVYFGAPRFYSQAGLVGTSVCVPIESSTGKRVGVLIGGVVLNELMERIADYPLQDGMILFLVDVEGTVIAHSGIDLFALESGPLSLNYSDHPLVESIIAAGGGGSEEDEEPPPFGTYAILESNGWGVVVEQPMSKILAKSNMLARWLLFLNIGLFVIAVGVMLMFTRRIAEERRRAEKEIRELTQYQESIIDNANVWVDVLDKDFNITLWNRAAEVISGYSREEVLGHNKIWGWLYPDDAYRNEVTEKVAAILEKGKVDEDLDTVIRCKDDQTRTIAWNVRTLLGETGQSDRFIVIGRDITLQRQHEEELIRMAQHDPLTGVYNRHYFDQVIQQEVSRSKRYGHRIGFLMVDIDRFKEVNDRFGHQMGDRVLQAVADILRHNVRESDVVVRYGGDEFLVVLLEANGETSAVVDRIRAEVAHRNRSNPLIEFPVTLAIGAVHWNSESGKPINSILSEADRLMYEEKKRFRYGSSAVE